MKRFGLLETQKSTTMRSPPITGTQPVCDEYQTGKGSKFAAPYEDSASLENDSERPADRRPKAISEALKAIHEALERGPVGWEIDSANEEPFKLWVAADRTQRERAYRFAYREYKASGFNLPNSNERIVDEYDGRPDSLTLLAEDSKGREAGTITLAFDAPKGLPCDGLYHDELAPLRSQGRRLAEVTRFAMAIEHKHSRTLLAI